MPSQFTPPPDPARIEETERSLAADGCPAILSLAAAADAAGLSYGHLWRAVARGELRAKKLGRVIRITRASLASYLS